MIGCIGGIICEKTCIILRRVMCMINHCIRSISPRFEIDNFIHCSYPDQVAPVAHRFYAGEPDLILLEIDIQKLSYPLVDENLEGGSELFPHIYGELPVDEIGRVYAFQYDDQGQWCYRKVLLNSLDI